MIRILLADDQALVRGALAALLDLEADIEVVAQVGRGDEVVDAARSSAAQVCLLDIEMPGLTGLEAAERLRAELPEVRLLIVTTFGRPGYVRRALDAGAAGYLFKDSAHLELIEAVRAAAAGGRRLAPEVAAGLKSEKAEEERPILSPRETEVLRLMALGHTNREAAEQLDLSVRTVETHRAHAQQKLGLSTRSDLTRYALDHGLIDT